MADDDICLETKEMFNEMFNEWANILNAPQYLLIGNLMGRTLKIPMSGTAMETAQPFFGELFSIAGVSELFEKYGAEWSD